MHNTNENIKWRATGSFVEEGYEFGGFSYGVKAGAQVAAEDGVLGLRSSMEDMMVVHGSLIKEGSIDEHMAQTNHNSHGGSTIESDHVKGVRDSF